MSEERPHTRGYKRHAGYSYGFEFPVRFTFGGVQDGWVVYNFRTGEVYAKNLKEWEAPGRCRQENARLGQPCIPDISAIDSTP